MYTDNVLGSRSEEPTLFQRTRRMYAGQEFRRSSPIALTDRRRVGRLWNESINEVLSSWQAGLGETCNLSSHFVQYPDRTSIGEGLIHGLGRELKARRAVTESELFYDSHEYIRMTLE